MGKEENPDYYYQNYSSTSFLLQKSDCEKLDHLKKVLGLLECSKDRSSASLVCKDWYNAERWSRTRVYIANCYSVTPEIVARRFPNIKSVTLKGRPRFSDFNLVPENWGAHIHPWLVCFSKSHPFLEELRLKRMTVSDESLKFLALTFPDFKRISLLSCDGFSTDGLAAIATHCKNLVELDIQDNEIDDCDGDWLSCFPESFTSLEILNFSYLTSEVDFSSLERLVARCKSLTVLKVNENINLEQLQRLLIHAPRLTQLGTGAFSQDQLKPSQYESLETVFKNYNKSLQTLSGLFEANPQFLPFLYPACSGLTFLNLNNAPLQADELNQLLQHCPNLRRLWVLDTVGDKGLEAVGWNCPLLEELRVFPASPFDPYCGVTGSGFAALSYGCPKLHYCLFFCHKMTNEAVATIVKNCPGFTTFRLVIMISTKKPMDEAFGSVVKSCKKLRRLSVSGQLSDLTFEYIGKYAKNLETLSLAFAGSSDTGMQWIMSGCPKLRRLEIRDCPFGNYALLSGMEKYESMRSLWMSACKVTISACRKLANKMPRLNVEVIRDEDSNDHRHANKLYVYRTVAGPRKDAPPCVLTL